MQTTGQAASRYNVVTACNSLQYQRCMLAELEDVLAEAQSVSPQVDAYLADSAHSNGKSGKKPVSRSNDLEAQ